MSVVCKESKSFWRCADCCRRSTLAGPGNGYDLILTYFAGRVKLTVATNLLGGSLEFRHIAMNCSEFTYIASIELLGILDKPQIAGFKFTTCDNRGLL